mgnify:CR=1 FL=1
MINVNRRFRAAASRPLQSLFFIAAHNRISGLFKICEQRTFPPVRRDFLEGNDVRHLFQDDLFNPRFSLSHRIAEVIAPDIERHKRVDVTRTYIYNKTQKYVIVLEPQMRNEVKSYYLLTSYYLNEEYGEKMLKKKMKSKIEVVL